MSKKLLSVILAIVVMASLCIVNASAANDQSATTGAIHAGDTVTFTASLKYGDDTHLVAAINATVTYDAEVLAIENVKKVEYPVFRSGTTNINTPGTVLFNAADGVNGFDFANGGDLVKITFNVLKDAPSTEIKFETAELFDVTIDPVTFQAADGVAATQITSGVTANAAVACPHVSDIDTTTDTSAKPTDTDKGTDTTVAPTTDTTGNNNNNNSGRSYPTGDFATVAMMIVFAAAVVVFVSKKRA